MPHLTFFPGNRETRTRLLLPLAILALLAALFASGGALASAAPAYNVTATVPVGAEPFGVAVDFATHTVYVTNFGSNSVSVIDEATNTVTTTVPVGAGPAGVAVDSATHTVYVTNFGSNSASVIDGSTNTVTATVPVGVSPFGVAVDSATDTVYVANEADSTVSVIDGSTNTVTATVPVGLNPMGVTVDSATNTVYVANFNGNSVSVIDGASNTVVATIPLGNFPEGVAVDSATHTVYVSNDGSNSVSVIDGDTDTVIATVPVGNAPVGVAVDSVTSTVYVANSDDKTVSAIDGATNTVTATVPVGGGPLGVAVDSTTHMVYVANSGDDTVSVITPGLPFCTTTCYVNGATGSDTRGNGSLGMPFATIQKGVDTVQDGGTVIVSAGTYNEWVVIDKGITLKGYKAGWDARYRTPSFGGETIVTPPPGKPAFDITTTEGVTVDGFTFQGNSTAVADGGEGIESWLNHDDVIDNDHFVDNIFNSLSVGIDFVDGTFTNTLIQRNLFNRNAAGVAVETADLDSLSIVDNTFTGNTSAGIESSTNNGSIGNSTISDNTSTRDRSFVSFHNDEVDYPNQITGNTVTQSTGDGIDITGYTEYLTIANNTVSGAAGAAIGVTADSQYGNCGLAISGNSLSTSAYGIQFGPYALFSYEGCVGASVTGNTLKANRVAAIAIATSVDTSGLAINDNSIAGNAAGLTNASGNPAFDATCNWWGSNSGPRATGITNGYGDSVSGLDLASFAPWRTSSNLSFPCDRTAPTIRIFAPTDGATYRLRQNVRPVFSCSDAGGSGVASCTVTAGGSNYNVDTSSSGPHTFTVTATDKAGNTTSTSVTYSVS